MKEELELIGWLISNTVSFFLALLLIGGAFFGFVYLMIWAKESGLQNVIVYSISGIGFAFSAWCFYIAYKQHPK